MGSNDALQQINLLTYENIIVLPYKVKLSELSIEIGINDHGKLYFTGTVPEESEESYIHMTESNTDVEVKYTGIPGNDLTLFKGIVKNIEINASRDVYNIKVEAVSHTNELDLRTKKRSFQNKDMTYGDLVKKVLSGYDGADYIDTCSKGKNLDKFILQYNETDWEFLKRMASHFNAPLIVDTVSQKPKFWFGLPKGEDRGSLDDFHYSVEKRIADYRDSVENYISIAEEIDFIYYTIESKRLMNLGDTVQYKGKKLVICQKSMQISKGIINNEYSMVAEDGLKQRTANNDSIMGVSLEGKVLEVKEDNIKVHLEIDKEQKKEEAWWFPYSTFYTAEGQTGWYCMPELGDSIKLYFPSNIEEEGVVINSVRRRSKGGDKITNPNIKFLRTTFGKELMFDDKEIVVTGKDEKILIKINENDGVTVFSSKDVKVVAGGSLKMSSQKKVIVSAGAGIDMVCKESLVKMDGSTLIKGSKIKRTSTGEVARLPLMLGSSDNKEATKDTPEKKESPKDTAVPTETKKKKYKGGGRLTDKTEAKPEDLVEVDTASGNKVKLEKSAAEALKRMLEDAKKDGIEPPLLFPGGPKSGYRNDTLQKQMFDAKVNSIMQQNPNLSKEAAEEIADDSVARPGGPHRTGKAIDFNLGVGGTSEASKNTMRETAAFKWLQKNHEKYGFYNYEFEPWHWEYNPKIEVD